jgi:hypothetical protein
MISYLSLSQELSCGVSRDNNLPDEANNPLDQIRVTRPSLYSPVEV